MRRCLYAALLILMAAAPAAWAEEPRLEKMRHKTFLVFTPHPDDTFLEPATKPKASSPALPLIMSIAADKSAARPALFVVLGIVRPLSELRDRPLAFDSLRALRSGDVTEAALVAVRNLQRRFGAGDDTQKILKSLDELRVHRFGRDVNPRTVVDDAPCGPCSSVRRNGLRHNVHIEHGLDPVRTSFPARLDVVDGRFPIAQRNEVWFTGDDHPRGQRQADGVFALEEDPLAEFPALEPQPAQLARVFDVPLHGVKVAGRLVVVFVVALNQLAHSQFCSPGMTRASQVIQTKTPSRFAAILEPPPVG